MLSSLEEAFLKLLTDYSVGRGENRVRRRRRQYLSYQFCRREDMVVMDVDSSSEKWAHQRVR